MPILDNARWENFARQFVAGRSATRAYINAGFSPHGAAQAAHKLLKHPLVADRIAELRREEAPAQSIAVETAEEVKADILRELKATVEGCMQHQPVLDARRKLAMVTGPDGKLHALHRFDAKNAIAALVVIGKELGMFGGRERGGHKS